MKLLRAIILLGCTPTALQAQTVITSPEPEAVSLTIYRDAYREDEPIDPQWPSGYALVTETRTVQIPAGESLVRFEGVAEGMFPESAIVTGLPKGVREKNRDARLLSPSGLVDAYLKRQVTITRTNRDTGAVREQQAMITAGPDGGVILQTSEGYEALRCTGLPERMAYGGVPEGLSAKPTLSVITDSDRAVTATLTLTYMAAGFDWQANYVTQVSPDKSAKPGDIGKSKVDVFAWLTLANGGNQSFLNANTMAIAGRPNREDRDEDAKPVGGALEIRCWPQQRTHEVPYRGQQRFYNGAMWGLDKESGEAIVVTGIRASLESSLSMKRSSDSIIEAVTVAEQEDLGDLKLYRIPEPVTVNAKGQKQVAMIVKPGAKFDRLYRYNAIWSSGDAGESQPMEILLRGENKKEQGLGLPLPSGQAMIFEPSSYGQLLAGEATLADRAIGEKVELVVGDSPDVRIRVTRLSQTQKSSVFKVEVSNARSEAVKAEVALHENTRGTPKDVAKVDGVPTWKITIPANGEREMQYSATEE
jgi:hypothetical protein